MNSIRTEEQTKIINKARRILKESIDHNRLAECGLYDCIRREWTGSIIFYHVTVGEYVVTFEDRSNKLWFEKIQQVGYETDAERKAREFILSMLDKPGTQAVMRNRYGNETGLVLRAARKLLERAS